MGKIMHGGQAYSGGGGTTVIANPSGTPSADLEKISIEGVLYGIPSGGGGTVTDVKVDSQSVVDGNGVANINTMTGAGSSSAGAKGLVPAPASGDNEKYLKGDGTWGTPSGGGGASAVSDLTDVSLNNLANGQILKYNSTTQKWENANESGGGGGGGGYSETTLFTGTNQTYSGEITLDDDLDNYDLVIFWTRWTATSTNCEVPFVADAKYFVSKFPYDNGSTAQTSPHMGLTTYYNQYVRVKMGTSKNKLFLFDSHSIALAKVTGIKFDGSGSGSAYERTELFKSSTNLAVWDASGITLSDDIEKYDEIEFVLGFASGTDLSKRTNKFGAKWFADNFAYSSAVATVSHALLLLWPNQGLSAAWDSTNKKVMMWGRNGTVGIYAVYGIKCGGGGGSGSSTLAGLTDVDVETTPPTDGQILVYDSTNQKWINADNDEVIANPTETPTATLTKLKVGNTVYELPSGGTSTEFISSFVTQNNSDTVSEYVDYEVS